MYTYPRRGASIHINFMRWNTRAQSVYNDADPEYIANVHTCDRRDRLHLAFPVFIFYGHLCEMTPRSNERIEMQTGACANARYDSGI